LVALLNPLCLIDMHFYWYQEVFRFLKSRSRVVSFADYAAEKSLILNIAHRMLLGDDEITSVEGAPESNAYTRPDRRTRDCPF
jgi:hypothetical protein